jgi:hypothetical protein
MRGALYSVYALAVLAVAGCGSDPVVVNIPTVKTVVVTPPTASLNVGGNVSLSVSMLDSVGVAVSGATATWTTTNAAVATVAAGVVTAVSPGSAMIIATSNTHSDTATITVNAVAPARFSNVFVVGLLQKDYSTFTAANMPFLDSLAKLGGKAAKYYGNTTPSIGNFFMLAAGDTVTNNDTSSVIYTGDNLVRQLVLAGKTWKSYAENIPSAGYTGPDNGLYIRRHNVFTLISDVTTSGTKAANLVPITQLQTDITNNALPNFGMIIPNDCNNSNTCSITVADSWLRTNLTPLLNSAPFQAGGNGLLIILFDRSSTSTFNGGGHVAWVVIGPRARVNYSSNVMYQHQSTLRLVMESLGVTAFPGRAATAASMSEFLNTP